MPDTTREPVLLRSLAVALAGALVALAARLGLNVDQDAVVDGLLVLGTLLAGWWARSHVTPVADPRDSSGPLVPAAEVAVFRAPGRVRTEISEQGIEVDEP